MSAEYFETVMLADLREHDGQLEWGSPGQEKPRGLGPSQWLVVPVRAEDALRIVADTVRNTKMHGISGDLAARRESRARLIEHAAELVRELAGDACGDWAFSPERWARMCLALAEEARDEAFYGVMEGRR